MALVVLAHPASMDRMRAAGKTQPAEVPLGDPLAMEPLDVAAEIMRINSRLVTPRSGDDVTAQRLLRD